MKKIPIAPLVASAATDAATADVQPDAAALLRDEHAGVGGSYEVKDGKRVLIERTQPDDSKTMEEADHG